MRDAALRKPLDEEIDRECLEAVRGARFEPGTLRAAPSPAPVILRLRFELAGRVFEHPVRRGAPAQ